RGGVPVADVPRAPVLSGRLTLFGGHLYRLLFAHGSHRFDNLVFRGEDIKAQLFESLRAAPQDRLIEQPFADMFEFDEIGDVFVLIARFAAFSRRDLDAFLYDEVAVAVGYDPEAPATQVDFHGKHPLLPRRMVPRDNFLF